jgi:hypothetical protein
MRTTGRRLGSRAGSWCARIGRNGFAIIVFTETSEPSISLRADRLPQRVRLNRSGADPLINPVNAERDAAKAAVLYRKINGIVGAELLDPDLGAASYRRTRSPQSAWTPKAMRANPTPMLGPAGIFGCRARPRVVHSRRHGYGQVGETDARCVDDHSDDDHHQCEGHDAWCACSISGFSPMSTPVRRA